MRSPATQSLHNVIGHALRLHRAVQRGDRLNLPHEQAILTNAVLELPSGEPGESFRGVRYAVVCWLDELFTCRSDWAREWNERKLESALYGSNDRAWEFWRQAKLAAARSTDDALAAYYLCVSLGFRGQLCNDPAALRAWFEQTRTRVTRVTPNRGSTRLSPRRRAPAQPLHGESRLRRFVAAAVIGGVCLAPLATYALMQRVFA